MYGKAVVAERAAKFHKNLVDESAMAGRAEQKGAKVAKESNGTKEN